MYKIPTLLARLGSIDDKLVVSKISLKLFGIAIIYPLGTERKEFFYKIEIRGNDQSNIYPSKCTP